MGIAERSGYLETIEQQRHSSALLFVTGDRPGMETQIGQDVVDLVVEHLDEIGPVPKISLVLHTKGGQTAAAWRIVNLLRSFADDLEVIVPNRAMSAGTLICLGANRIVMTKQANLGPIDPSIHSALNPQIPGGNPQAKAPVSVEAVQGYLDIAKEDLGIKDQQALANVLIDLSNKVHPLVLGEIFRQRSQIRSLAQKLLNTQVTDSSKLEQIIAFLCSESGSHDYAITRREAAEMGLNIEKPTKNATIVFESPPGDGDLISPSPDESSK